MENPWSYLKSQIISELERALIKLKISTIPLENLINFLEEPPDTNLGDFAVTICFHLAKNLKKAPRQIAEMISGQIQLKNLPYFSKIEVAGAGYLNFFINWQEFNREVLNQIIEKKETYGNSSIGKGKKTIVEHTSPNPTKPLHMGTMRCAVLGDITGRLMKKAGYKVEVENYMDDLGRQVAVLTWGILNLNYEDCKKEAPDAKEDYQLGILYSKAAQLIEEDSELEKEVQKIIAKLEVGDPKLAPIADEIVDKALKGQLETAWRMNIFYDLLIWESDVIASGIFEETLQRLLQSKNVYKISEGEDKGCIVVDMSEFGETFQQMEKPYKTV